MASQLVYRALLLFYPSAFRDEYGDQMRLMFTEQMAHARCTGGLLKQFALWAQVASDALTIAPKEHCHVVFQDVRWALRTIAATPGFAAVSIMSLALGIGGNSAIFSIWNGLLYSSLPKVNEPKELVVLSNPATSGVWFDNFRGSRNLLTYGEFENLRDHSRSFSGLMASQSGLASLQVHLPGAGWEGARERLVSGTYFQVLGVGAAVGRVFSPEDDREALPHAVLSYEYWQRRFGGRLGVLGTTLVVGPLGNRNANSPETHKTALTIIGVAPRGFIGETAGQQPDVWIPLRMQLSIVPIVNWLDEKPPHKVMWLHVFGRLKAGVTMARADAEANAVFKAGLESFYGLIASEQRRRELMDQRLKLQPGGRGASESRVNFSISLTGLLAAVGLLLLIVCANLASLQLARGAARKPEIALRLSLGASRGRLIRQLTTESLVLAAMGTAAALGVAYLARGVLVKMLVQQDRNFQLNFELSPVMLIFTLAMALSAAVLFGLLPAWQATKADLGTSLKEQSRGVTNGIGEMRWGRSLVSLQLALCLPLLVSAGLLVRTVYNLQHLDLGYPTGNLLVARIDLYGNAHPGTLLPELLRRVQATPGVQAASFSGLGFFSGDEYMSTVEIEGYVPRTNNDRESVLDRIGPRYFSALGVPVTRGREILERDEDSAPKICVVNQAFAERFFAGRNPIGMHILSLGLGSQRTAYQVVGVVQDVRTQNLRGQVNPRYFIAQEQDPTSINMPAFLIRTSGGTAPVLEAVRRTIRSAKIPLISAGSMEEQIAPLMAQDRMTAQLALVFAGVAVALAAIGLYGVLAHGVARRQSEIAIRIAVGAEPRRVISMILRETAGLVVVGLLVGAGLSYTALHWINSMLYGVTVQDPLTLAVAIALLVFVAFGAAYLPARRASKLDPTEALRRE